MPQRYGTRAASEERKTAVILKYHPSHPELLLVVCPRAPFNVYSFRVQRRRRQYVAEVKEIGPQQTLNLQTLNHVTADSIRMLMDLIVAGSNQICLVNA